MLPLFHAKLGAMLHSEAQSEPFLLNFNKIIQTDVAGVRKMYFTSDLVRWPRDSLWLGVHSFTALMSIVTHSGHDSQAPSGRPEPGSLTRFST